jgi:hypothetical protein
MKTKAFLPVVVSSLVVEDSSALLALSQATASNLLAAVGHRNVTTMQALVQELAEESVNEPGWKFSKDIQDALHGIRDMFVKSIQNTLKKEHKDDQNDHNEHTETCFGGCVKEYESAYSVCDGDTTVCEGLGKDHMKCRADVYLKYKDMGIKCGKLHCWQMDDIMCKGEYCTAPPVDWCHERVATGAYPTVEECLPHAPKVNAEIKSGGFPDKYTGKIVYTHVGGVWLKEQLAKFEKAKETWDSMYKACSAAYLVFLEADKECDGTQKKFEKCMCDKGNCEDRVCNVDYQQCEDLCWKQYEDKLQAIECREKDRKIDWSATKKIECYVDVLLHNYTKKELLTRCAGADNCINKLREEDYKKCAMICPHIDYDGEWPEVDYSNYTNGLLNPKLLGNGFNKRAAHDEFHLGDGDYKYDANGQAVFTKHRSPREMTDARHAEDRCTEHLDIDYQIPKCKECEGPPPPVCDCNFHEKWYWGDVPGVGSIYMDDPRRIGCIDDCCSEPKASSTCFDDEDIKSCWDEHKTRPDQVWTRPNIPGAKTHYPDVNVAKTMFFSEHTHAWAFNRCECTPCGNPMTARPAYGARPAGRQCGNGPHTFSRTRSAYDITDISMTDKNKVAEFKNVCIGAKGGNFGSVDFTQAKEWGLKKEHGQRVSGNDVCIEKITFTHVSGSLSCRTKESGNSNWGCDERSVGLVLTDSSDTLIAPAFGTAVGMTPAYTRHAPWYTMNGVQHDSEQMEVIFRKPFLFGSDEYKLWYGEDLTGGTEGDNRGEACFDIAFQRAEHVTRCTELTPLQFHGVCVSADDKEDTTITLPEDTHVASVVFHPLQGNADDTVVTGTAMGSSITVPKPKVGTSCYEVTVHRSS